MLSGLELNPDGKTPMYYQLYEWLRQAILAGRMRPGQRLPPTRDLAQSLSVSRSTILLAFDYLLTEGYIEGRTGSGTFVTSTIPEELLQMRTGGDEIEEAPRRRLRLSRRAETMSDTTWGNTRDGEILPFRPGIPALQEFPYDLWLRILAREIRFMPREKFGYDDPAGYFPLRHVLADYLRVARAIRCEPEQIIIVNGSQQALDVAGRVLLDAGDCAWIEDPGYPGAREALRASGAHLIPVPLDAEGLDIAAGAASRSSPRLVYVTPSHQYPLGITMSLRRRLELLDWAAKSEAWILEDDYDSEYRYGGKPLSSLQGLDQNHRVIYMGTFSKVLFPALRLGYLVVPAELIPSFVAAKALSDRNSPVIEQATLTAFIRDGHFGRHVRKMRILYHERQKVLLDAVAAELQGALLLKPADTGLHIVGWLRRGANDEELSQQAQDAGVWLSPLSAYTMEHSRNAGVVLGYAAYNEEEIRKCVARLATVLA